VYRHKGVQQSNKAQMTAAETYARWVLDPANAIKTGRLIKLAAERFLLDLERTDIYFDEEQAMTTVNFMERYCNQWEGKWRGKPFVLEPWQHFHLQQLKGWIVKETGFRRFTKFYLQISKKNGKSSECAGIALDHVFADRIDTPKVYTAANNEDQAKICVNMAGRIIEQSPDLYQWVEDGEVKLSTYGKNITEVIHKERDGFITALSKEGGDKKAKTSGGKHGINASLGLVDEFGLSPDHGASGSIYTSMASRDERLMAYLTTAGFNLLGPCYTELRDQGIKVLTGVVEMDNYLPIIYELDKPIVDGKEAPITVSYLLANPEVWLQCNPNLGVSVNKEYLQEMLLNAQNLGGTTEVDVLTLNFNVWMDSAETFIPSEIWDANTHGEIESDLLGMDCYGGIEIGASGQISSVCLLFPGDIVKIKMMFFISEAALKQNEFFRDNEEFIKVDPGNEVENDIAVKWIEEEFQKYHLNSFCFSNVQKNNSIIQALIKLGYTGNPISQGLQGISNATTEYEKALRAGEVEHFGNPILKWMNSNCLAVRKEAGTRIEKNGKVLGIYAILNAWSQWRTIAATETDDQIIMRW
jgi:phage terminase large subunit-like protein